MNAAATDGALAAYALARADDALVLGHRLSEWCGHGPMLEEDMALANMGLDLIGQARSLYQYAAELRADGSTEDTLAYFRNAPDWRNLLLVERPNGDFAATILRQFLYSAYADPYWRAMTRSTDPTLAAIAAKSEKETAYHLRHTSEWVIRLGDGTEESARRLAAALDALWPFVGELFEVAPSERRLVDEGVAVDPETLRPIVRRTIATVFEEALLTVPDEAAASRSGGRRGEHSDDLVALLADMQVLQRAHPGATW